MSANLAQLNITTETAWINGGIIGAGYDPLTITPYSAAVIQNPVKKIFANFDTLSTTTYTASWILKHATFKPKVKVKWRYRYGKVGGINIPIKWRTAETEFTPGIDIEWKAPQADYQIDIKWVESWTETHNIDIEWVNYYEYS